MAMDTTSDAVVALQASCFAVRLDAVVPDQARKEKARPCGRAFGIEPGDDLLSHAKCTLPSAQLRFTSEFGMGSGGATALMSPGRGWRVAVRWIERFAHTLSLVCRQRMDCSCSLQQVRGT